MRILRLALVAVMVWGCTQTGGFGVGTGGTFVVQVGQENFRVRIDNTLLAAQARRMMVGAERPQIVNGTLARGDGGFNTGYGWHIRPETMTLSDATIALCDGRPSDVQSNINHWVDTVKQYCPWSGRFISEVGR